MNEYPTLVALINNPVLMTTGSDGTQCQSRSPEERAEARRRTNYRLAEYTKIADEKRKYFNNRQSIGDEWYDFIEGKKPKSDNDNSQLGAAA